MFAQLTDTLNLLSKLSFRKVINVFLILKTYYLSKYSKKLIQSGLPISLAFEPTTTCNLKCPQCPSGLRQFSRPTGKAETAIFEKLVDEVSPTLLYLTLYFQGEPYLHPQFLDLVNYAHQNKIYTATSTNAHYLTDENAKKTVESGLDRIIISLDGTTQESYQKYRLGGKLEKVIKGIETLVHWKKKLKLDILQEKIFYTKVRLLILLIISEYFFKSVAPFRKDNSTTNENPATVASCIFINSAAAQAVPPVANKSSCIKTFQLSFISSWCISISADPYSKS